MKSGNSLAVTGANGSGKSTLLEIIAAIKRPTRGSLIYSCNDKKITPSVMKQSLAFSSPRINPYNELTGYENAQFVCRGQNRDMDELFQAFNLYKDKDKKTKHYSSGMRQRLRFMLAVLHNPNILLLDEPGANLDRKGKDIIYSYIESLKEEKVIIIATNEEEEAALCNERIRLGS